MTFLGSITNTVRIFKWVNYDKDSTDVRAYRKGKTLCITVSRILLIKHIIEGGNFPVLVGNLHGDIKDCINQNIAIRTMGNSTLVGPYLAPKSLISSTHLLWSLRPLAEIPMSLTLRLVKSPARRATSPSSVVQTGVKSPGCEKRIA